MERKTRECSFAVMTSTGEQPDSTIYMAGFREERGIEVTAQLSGGLRDHAMMACEIVKSVGANIREKDSLIAAAAFVSAVGDALKDGAGIEALEMASKMLGFMSDPRKMAEALAKAMDEGFELDLDDMEGCED